jgi:hypothetical protein
MRVGVPKVKGKKSNDFDFFLTVRKTVSGINGGKNYASGTLLR